MNVFEKIKDCVINGDVPGAITLLKDIVPVEHSTELILILAQYERVKKEERSGTITYDDKNIQLSRINLAIINIYENAMRQLPNPIPSSDSNENAIHFENYLEWNYKSAFYLLEKKVDIDFSPCHDNFEDIEAPTIVEYLEQTIQRKNEGQDFFVMPASSDKQYPVFETTPKPDKVLKIDSIEAIPAERKKYESIAFYNVKKYSNNNIFSIRQKKYLPIGICKEKNNAVSIGSQYSCREFVINLFFSVHSYPKDIRYFEIPEFSFSNQSTGVSYNRYPYENPELLSNTKESLYCLSWKISSPKDGHIYTISWNMAQT
jgi:Effector-associated domain 11